jgi:2-C-methyl-D-erythritol 4-phosphate cytidylyltransferase/2-C-methyl-D-erythritol 2,4-cyclodiphosphate synthase
MRSGASDAGIIIDFERAFGDNGRMSHPQSVTPKPGQKLTVAAIIVAAGRSARMGTEPQGSSTNGSAAGAPTDTPLLEKQFQQLCGVPVLAHSVSAFLSHPLVTTVIIVTAEGREDAAREALAGIEEIARGPDHKNRISIVTGGARRQDSVRAGLNAASASGADLVAIHDAARPFLPHAVIDRLVQAILSGARAALPVMPVVDTLKHVAEERVNGTMDRSSLAAAQTPQLFYLADITALHARHEPGLEMTDDIGLAEKAGLEVAAVKGAKSLMKLTVAEDFTLLAALASSTRGDAAMIPDIRVGNGFDVHKFSDEPGPIYLAGIEVASKRGMLAHSDGDIGLHALCDAIFGAVGDGDIGSHFPPSDAKWRNADSAMFMRFAAKKCAEHNAVILHLDLTLICETPKIGPLRDAMRARIAQLAGIEIGRVGVKATTSEGLGFTGRGEGIAAQATATIALTHTPSDVID